ncbi:hypothetical protein NDU88_005749 [Pleurodeles waltl]|uniref:Reverse transcriptase domain-containing protein n=1 Tax=Pleurodeles waltl TaxID=8319 RepID=A0AAV7QJT5_PLEWA|nr:hypothetical protein NDU88_005749 [Pleurodeles waltl]
MLINRIHVAAALPSSPLEYTKTGTPHLSSKNQENGTGAREFRSILLTSFLMVFKEARLYPLDLAIGFGKVVISIKDNNISTFIGIFYDDITVGFQMFYRCYMITVNIGSREFRSILLTSFLMVFKEARLYPLDLAIGFGKVVISIKDNNISTFIGLFYDDITVGSQMFYRRYMITVNIGSREFRSILLTSFLMVFKEARLYPLDLAIGFGKVVISIKDNNISTFIGLFYDDITVGSQMFYRRYMITVNIGR